MPEKEYIYCLKCKRKLKTEDAKLRGYGYICWKKHLNDISSKSNNLLFKITEDK